MQILKTGIVALTFLMSATLGTATHGRLGNLAADSRDVDCLAKNIYHEARGESLEGQIAVAQVTVNRVHSNRFQNSVCAVVYARKQFSWTLDKTKRIRDQKAWLASVSIARAVLTQSVHLPNFKAHFFHTKSVRPAWAKNKRVLATIGSHVFYS